MIRPLTVLALLALFSSPQSPLQSSIAKRFGWLAGCWTGKLGASEYRELWMPASADLMLGMSSTTDADTITSFEFLRIAKTASGFDYIAQPNGAPPTIFTLGDPSNPDLNVFSNPAHEFPKRVVYQHKDATHLLAWIDGGDGSTKKIEFPMTRGAEASCTSASSTSAR